MKKTKAFILASTFVLVMAAAFATRIMKFTNFATLYISSGNGTYFPFHPGCFQIFTIHQPLFRSQSALKGTQTWKIYAKVAGTTPPAYVPVYNK